MNLSIVNLLVRVAKRNMDEKNIETEAYLVEHKSLTRKALHLIFFILPMTELAT